MTDPAAVRVVRTRAELAELGPPRGLVAVVMTMGALHAGHAALIDRARTLVGPEGRVLVTVFVNPRQFGAGEDFDAYPRSLEADIEVCSRHGADAVFAPEAAEVYPPPGTVAAGISVDPGPLGDVLEGRSRPGHFAGMLTVVAKFLLLIRPDLALFGKKDYQQLVLIRAMVVALDIPVEVVGVDTVREADGLALSSRNSYLSEDARRRARAIPEAISAGLAAAPFGVDAVVAAVTDRLEREGLVPDYVAVTGPDLGPTPEEGAARLLVAVDVDGTRLLDNAALVVGVTT